MTTHLRVIKGGEAMGMGLADYIWLDDEGDILFKKRVILIGKDAKGDPVPMLDRWTYCDGCGIDGCEDDECEHPEKTYILSPCFYLPDPLRPQPSYIVLCEVRDAEDQTTDWNSRRTLRKGLELRGHMSKLVWFGFEQEFRLFDGPHGDDPSSRKRFQTTERHFGACLDSGLLIHSAWNEPMSRVNEFKVGYRAFPQDMDPDPPSALTVADHLIIARYLMEKIARSNGIYPTWEEPNAFVSSPGLREPGADLKVQSHIIEAALQDLGKTRIVPRADGRGYQCIEVLQSKLTDPYRLAIEMLDRFWPVLQPEESPE